MEPIEFKRVLKESEPLWNGKFPSIATSPGVSDGPLRPPTAAYDEKLWNVGWTDGASGQPPEHGEQLVRAYNDHRTERMRYELAQMKSVAETRASVLKDWLSRMKPDVERSRQELAQLESQQLQDPHEFSLVTGTLYVIVAFILMLSDMPLSLSLVAEGFRLPLKKEIEATGRTVSLPDLFSRDWQEVLQYLWQPIVLAVGIAFLGIFFKITVDYLLSSGEGAPESRYARAIKYVRRGFFAVAFALMLFGLFSVGTLRSRQQILDTTEGELDHLQQPASVVAVNPAVPSPEKLAEEKQRRELEDMKRSQTTDADTWTSRSFIALALTLPLIGGICFSVGSKRVQRFFQLQMARVRAVWRHWLFDLRQRKQVACAADAAFLSEEIALLERRRSEVAPTALDVYLHGYTRGLTMPQKLEPHRSLYAHCKDVLQQWIAAGVQEGTIERIQRFGRSRR